MKKSIVLMMMIAGLAPMVANAQLISKKGTGAAQFLHIPVGARAAGLGGAVTASVADASAMYWNPGGLAGVRTRQALIEHSSWIGDLQHNYLAVALPISGAGTLGLSMVALTMGDMEETTFEQQDGTGRMFGASSYAVGVSYGQYLLRTFAIGGTVKFVTERIFNTSASTVAVDLGTIYQTPFEPLRFGVRIANFGPKMRMLGDDLIVPTDTDPNNNGNPVIDALRKTKRYAMPLTMQAGLALDALDNDRIRATIMVDATSPSDNNQSLNVGTELSFFNDLFSVQAGLPELGLKDRTWNFAAGGSVNYRLSNGTGLSVGYAAQDHKWLGLTNRISMKLNF